MAKYLLPLALSRSSRDAEAVLLLYVAGTNFRTSKAVVVFDVVVGMLSYVVGTNFRTRKAVRGT